MSLTFRNIDASRDEPVRTWPFEAILAALERGGLPEWRRLAGEIGADPWGRVARDVEQAVEVAEPFGIGPVMRDLVADARRDDERSERDEVAHRVRAHIAASGLSRAEFASALGTSASRLSTYATGRVAPSATLMVRMERVAERHTVRSDVSRDG